MGTAGRTESQGLIQAEACTWMPRAAELARERETEEKAEGEVLGPEAVDSSHHR